MSIEHMGRHGKKGREQRTGSWPRVALAIALGTSILAGCGGAERDLVADRKAYLSEEQSRRMLRRPDIDLATGGMATTSAGAQVTVLEGTGQGRVTITGNATGTAGARVTEGVVVSADHAITAHGFSAGGAVMPFLVTLPVEVGSLPVDFDHNAFAAQTYDAAADRWVATDGHPVYDADARTVTFQTGHLSKWRVVHQGYDNVLPAQLYVYYTDRFAIHYLWPVGFGQTSEFFPVDDQTWRAQGIGRASDPQTPDYIEDLGFALEDALTAILDFRSSDGRALFAAPDSGSRIEVQVTYLKDGAGDSRLGGPMRIKSRLANRSELELTAAHELVHVLQDQHYTMLGAATNRWFFEATANLLSARAFKLDRAAQVAYFSKESSRYLTSSLDASLEGSFYAAADFLGWLEARAGKQLTADVILADWVFDLSALSGLFSGSTQSLGDRFREYLLQATVGNHDYRPLHLWKSLALTQQAGGQRRQFEQFHLSGHAIEVRTDVPVDGLLVATSGRHYPVPIPLESHSYVGTAPHPELAYPLERATPAGKPVVVRHFGKPGTPGVKHTVFQQVIVNPLERDATVWGTYTFDYYLLAPPEVVPPIAPGHVAWRHDATVLPVYDADPWIRGFNVYVDKVRLNATPLQGTSLADPRIIPGSDVRVTVVDRYGHEWPEIEPQVSAPFTRLLEACASFTYMAFHYEDTTRVETGPHDTVQCVEPPSSASFAFDGRRFEMHADEATYAFGTYEQDYGGTGVPKLWLLFAGRLIGEHQQMPYDPEPFIPRFEIATGFMRRVLDTTLVRFEISASEDPDGYFGTDWHPGDVCSGGTCWREFADVVPGTFRVWVTFVNDNYR